jgi:long-subunit fatty acid transport protein
LGAIERDIQLSLQDTTRELTSVGLSANADYNIMKSDYLNISLGFGFGLYRWESSLGSYHDSLYYRDESGTEMLVEILKIPSVKQVDWSGGFNAGVNVDLHVFGPLWLNLGANYKNIVGEMWAVLSLDMENVSTFQMFQTKAGLFVRL